MAGAAAERAAEDLEAARRAAYPRVGWIPSAGRWARELLWDGSHEDRLRAASAAAAPGTGQ
ncbi:hypothetical protein VI817_005922 [Penicillium citrinum]|nr:hypothetical protein VI817_005922 [Penicillium citrinum]